jgi:hypothetical protein
VVVAIVYLSGKDRRVLNDGGGSTINSNAGMTRKEGMRRNDNGPVRLARRFSRNPSLHLKNGAGREGNAV